MTFLLLWKIKSHSPTTLALYLVINLITPTKSELWT